MTNLFRPHGAFGWFSYTTSWDTIDYPVAGHTRFFMQKRFGI